MPTPLPKPKGHRNKAILVGVLAATVLVEAFLFVGGFAFLQKGGGLASVLPGVVAVLTNDAREEESLLALSESEVLARGAQLKADDMASKGYFSHTGPDGSAPWKWFQAAGYRYEYAGENLAVNFNESEDVVDAWLKSPTHRANIMKANFTEVGIGVATGTYKGKEATFVVQFFGKPAVGRGLATTDDGAAARTAANEFLAVGTVLGTSTSPMLEQFLYSPNSEHKQIFFVLLGGVVLLIVVGLLFGKRFPKLWPTIAILLALVVLLTFALFNKDYLLGVTVVE